MAPQSVLTLVDIARATTIAYNEKNFDKIRSLLAPNAVYDEVGTGRRLDGVNEIVNAFKAWATALPDSKAEIVHEYLSDNTVILELVWTGTHTGLLQTPNGTLPPTGKRINVRACELFQFAGEKILTARHYFDMTTLLKQLGVPLGK